ncbi:MAG: ribosomal-processing cysteine protease Prp [Clostridia bacterium]|nr:ribosomal-processing cysteine protease Prp [Clostridia bacterium]
MVNITFYKRNGVYYKFVEEGHALFDEAGNDIVCAAISAMTMLVVNSIEVSFASNVDYKIDGDENRISVTAMDALSEFCTEEKRQYAVAGIIQAYYLELMSMLDDYYDYIDVNEIEEE